MRMVGRMFTSELRRNNMEFWEKERNNKGCEDILVGVPVATHREHFPPTSFTPGEEWDLFISRKSSLPLMFDWLLTHTLPETEANRLALKNKQKHSAMSKRGEGEERLPILYEDIWKERERDSSLLAIFLRAFFLLRRCSLSLPLSFYSLINQ